MIRSPRTPADERGSSAVEYALLLSGIALLLVIVVFALGGSTLGLFDDSCAVIDGQIGTGTC